MTDPLVNDLTGMSAYERQAWKTLSAHWQRRSDRRKLPAWATDALEHTSEAARTAVRRGADAVPEAVKEPIRRAGDAVTEKAAAPVLKAAVAMLELFNDWALELNNPTSVEKLASRNGLEISSFVELRQQDLKVCDRLLVSNTLKWRTVGAVEGGGMGVLALVPVAGLPVAIGADILVVQVLSSAIAANIAYSYGYDAKDPAEQDFIQRLVRQSFMAQAAKAKPLRDAGRAAHAIKDRVRWSDKLRADHRLVAALEKLLQQVGPAGAKVPVQQVAKFLPVVGILVGAGVNSTVLANVAADTQRYCQTRFLSDKYGLPLPAALSSDDQDENAA